RPVMDQSAPECVVHHPVRLIRQIAENRPKFARVHAIFDPVRTRRMPKSRPRRNKGRRLSGSRCEWRPPMLILAGEWRTLAIIGPRLRMPGPRFVLEPETPFFQPVGGIFGNFGNAGFIWSQGCALDV